MINKYIYLVYNRKLIQNDEFGESTFKETSFMRRLPLDKNNQEFKVFHVRSEHFHSVNGYLPSWLWRAHAYSHYSYYNFYQQSTIKYYWNQKSLQGLMIGVDEDVWHTTRRIYSFSEWFSDVGGFLSSVTGLIALILPFIIRKSIESKFIKELFKRAPPGDNNMPHMHADNNTLIQHAKKQFKSRTKPADIIFANGITRGENYAGNFFRWLRIKLCTRA